MAAYMSYHETPDSEMTVRWAFDEKLSYLDRRGPGVEFTDEDFGHELQLRYWLVERNGRDVLLVSVEGATNLEDGSRSRGFRGIARRAGVSDEEVEGVIFERVDAEHQSRLFGHYNGGREYLYAW